VSKSKIEWTENTWNPITGCSIVSPGCTNCYAMRDAWRKHHNPKLPHYRGLTKKVNGHPVWTGTVRPAPEHILRKPLRTRKPTLWFVNSMSDLFHEDVPDEWIDWVFAVMTLCPQHTFQVLTKRAKRMREYMNMPGVVRRIYGLACDIVTADEADVVLIAPSIDPSLAPPGPRVYLDRWPLPNVWLGVSAERQQEADERIPHLLQTPAAVRFVSAEPLLGPLSLRRIKTNGGWYDAVEGWRDVTQSPVPESTLDWVIVGGESGPGARPMHPDWARGIRDQCAAAGVAFFFKQWGAWSPGRQTPSLDDAKLSGIPCRIIESNGCGVGTFRVGKKPAGRLLDGVEHNAMPEWKAINAGLV
jgi:protein gp37